ncbi:helix-turn-helix domain-containing protein [Microbacterium sp. 10M-3C3]|jgi:DNA-binding IclR family transcriptional regulator|uniref:helix-turn-helix domain-containing protein n=1 Tax=Microbacterium sp. 10M-3C3 TaxID=2483401 RepID=UPI00197B3DF1|nr:helix-turn-helix domain-containing protein [Microbacterium sp. 10M-3C3]
MLRLLAERTAPVPAATLARELGVPRSSLYQLARAMMDEGFLVHYPEERAYGLSSLVSEIGAGSLHTDRLRAWRIRCSSGSPHPPPSRSWGISPCSPARPSPGPT